MDPIAMRSQLARLTDDIREIRDQGKKAKDDPNEVWLFRGMMCNIKESFSTYETIYNDLSMYIDSEGKYVITNSDQFQRMNIKRYFHESHGYLSMVDGNKEASNRTSDTTVVVSRVNTNLPNIKFPKFNGDRTKWPRFKDTFVSLVTDDVDLPDIKKFHYLLDALEGPPLAVIARYTVTSDNFPLAWAALEKQYENKRLIAASYLDQLLDIKPLTSKPNANILNKLVTTLSETIAAFKLIDIGDREEFLYFHLACRCLDTTTREQFELQNKATFPTFDKLMEYLRSRCDAAELAVGLGVLNSRDKLEERKSNKPWSGRDSSTTKSSLLVNSTYNLDNKDLNKDSTMSPNRKLHSCFICKGPHILSNCVKFCGASVAERHRMIRSWDGCKNCLYHGHTSFNCSSKYSCKFCRGKHHSLLHGYNPSVPKPPSREENKSLDSTQSAIEPTACSSRGEPKSCLNAVGADQFSVMLGTAICHISDSHGRLHKIRLAIDTGSDFSSISRSFAEKINLKMEPHRGQIYGFGALPVPGFVGRARCALSPTEDNSQPLETSVLVVETITFDLPRFSSDKSLWNSYLHHELADPQFWVVRPIDLLLGCDVLADVLTGQLISVLPGMPKLLGTIFGYSVIGSVKIINEVSSLCAMNITSQSAVDSPNNDALSQQLSKFWEIEEPIVTSIMNPEEEQCETFFRETYQRSPTGRYIVRLPFKMKKPQLFGSRNLALKRLEHLESKLQRSPILRTQYNNFMREYLELGHMERAKCPGKVFIPHHCVFKGEGDNAKIRVVFDAAAKTSNGSLNDCLLTGPKLQTNMVDIVLNFRQYQYVFTTDIVKMFRQILIHEDDRQYLHILWRFNPEDAVEDYELLTVTYGTAPAPYLAIRSLRQLAEDEGAAFPLAATAIQRDTYVDDLVTGARTLSDALELQRQVIALLAKGEFSLGKWTANHPDLLIASQQLSDTAHKPISLNSGDDNSVKILGLQWDPMSDCFSFSIVPPNEKCTKRAVLSSITKIYDPLGYIGPVVVIAKIIVQESWKRKLSWDEEFPWSLKDTWLDFVKTLNILSNLHIPRWIVPDDGPFQILIFADASERAYCASAYLRSTTEKGVKVHLLYAKTKLAPVKTLTIPRLELCAALLAGRVWQSLQNFCSRLPSIPWVYFFSDSMVVLSWLQTPTYRLKTFVANRVERIHELTNVGTWSHVASCDNPSDLGSRGVRPEDLINNKLWFEGPGWAKMDPSDWPVLDPPFHVDSAVTEYKPKALDENDNPAENSCLALVARNQLLDEPIFVDWFIRFSQYRRLKRSMAYVIRFLNHSRKKYTKVDNSLQDFIKISKTKAINIPVLTLSELEHSELTVFHLIQRHHYYKDKPLSSDSVMPKELRSLNPFCDEAGVMLVGGRLKHSNLPYRTKHPVIIPGKCHVARLIVEHEHKALCHCGATTLLATLRSRYWITGARNLVRRITRQCVACKKHNGSPVQPAMGDLPAVRFKEGRAFCHTGIDFAGPFCIRDSLRRKAQTSKCYLCIFVCLSTKAVHLELVSSLSTEAFCAALDRFIGRRGLPEKILSDNGTNFLGAANLLEELYQWYFSPTTQEKLNLYAQQKILKWSFTPPHAPSFGGIWEAGVKSVKRLLRAVYSDSTLTFEELDTWLIRIEAILNSRPLCPLSDDPTDLDFLTPGHFLIGSPLLTVPEKSLLHFKENRLSRWQLIRQKAEHFWHRWRNEYLPTLQERIKWTHPSYNLKKGDMVILKEDFTPRLRWPVGRVEDVFPGKDGIVRVVAVRSRHSVFTRPVNKLIPLLPDEDGSSNSTDVRS